MKIEELISKYLSGSATEDEKDTLLLWLEEEEGNRMKFGEMYNVWLYSHASSISDEELEAAFRRFKRQTITQSSAADPFVHTGKLSLEQQITEQQIADTPKIFSATSLRASLMRIAVSVLLLITAGYAGYLIRDRQAPEVAINRLLTGADGKGEYVLPDGSKVWLNANSILEYPESFTGKKRVVKLEGEALFDVEKDADKPFYVVSDGIEVEVLGTRFLVSNYADKPVVETMLVNGSVKVGGSYFSTSYVLHPGELITYNKQTDVSKISQVDANDYTNWIHSKLVFDKTNLANVIVNLEKWYGVEIVASPEMAENMHMTFTIRRESLEDILKYMSVTSNIIYKWENGTLYLFPRK